MPVNLQFFRDTQHDLQTGVFQLEVTFMSARGPPLFSFHG